MDSWRRITMIYIFRALFQFMRFRSHFYFEILFSILFFSAVDDDYNVSSLQHDLIYLLKLGDKGNAFDFHSLCIHQNAHVLFVRVCD